MNCFKVLARIVTKPEEAEIRNAGTDGSGNPRTVCRVRIAVRRGYKNRNGEYDSDFFTVQAWNGAIDVIFGHMKQGGRCIMELEVNNNDFTDRDGNKRYDYQFTLRNIEVIDWKPQDEENNGGGYNNDGNGGGQRNGNGNGGGYGNGGNGGGQRNSNGNGGGYGNGGNGGGQRNSNGNGGGYQNENDGGGYMNMPNDDDPFGLGSGGFTG